MSDKNRKVGCVQICIVDYQYDFFSNPCEWDCFERHIIWFNNMIIRQHPSLRSPPVGGKDLTKLWPLCPPGIEIVIWFRYQLFFSKKKNRWELGVPDIQHSIIDHGIQFCTALLQRFKNIHGLNSLVSLVFGVPQASGGFNPTRLKNHAPQNWCAKCSPMFRIYLAQVVIGYNQE